MLKCWWLMGCGMLIVGGAGMAGTVADQALGKGWDDGMTVGRGTRHQTPDLFQIHKIRVKILHLSRPHKW